MADTTKPALKEHYDYVQEINNEQEILDKFNAATIAQYNAQREQNRQNENAFYNQMYNTQKTAMDTIRQSNAAAVSTGASRGVQAANELSALLGLQQESVQSATELAQANRQTAQEETAAVLENVLNAYKFKTEQDNALITQGIQAGSVGVEEANVLWNSYLQAQANGDSAAAAAAWEKLQGVVNSGSIGATGNTPAFKSEYSAEKGMTFSPYDLTNKNNAAVYDVLKQAGYATNTQQIMNINNTSDYDLIDQIDFNSSKQEGKALEYVQKIQTDAKENKIPVGALVQFNYGAGAATNDHTFVYLGNGNFARAELSKMSIDFVDQHMYIPEGYKANVSYDVEPVNGRSTRVAYESYGIKKRK